METMDQRGTLLPSRGEAKEEEEGGGLYPPLSGWRRNTDRSIIITVIYTNTSVIFTNISITLPPSISGVTPLLPAVIST